MRSRRPLTTPRHSRSKARSKALAALALERTQAVAGLECRANADCLSPARCRAAGCCLGVGAALGNEKPREPG